MQRKIGEIFEFNGEWYQCVESDGCALCAFNEIDCDDIDTGSCDGYRRRDGKSVIFKKLEKLGEPFERNGYMYQEYKAHIFPLLMNGDAKIPTRNGFAVIIKQTKEEDMKTVRISKDDLNFLVNKIRYGILPKCTGYDEIVASIIELFSIEDVNLSNSENIGKNLKPFDLEAAKSGKPVCTRDGRKARIICFDAKCADTPIVALVSRNDGEILLRHYKDGKLSVNKDSDADLMMSPEKKEGWVNVYKGNNGISERVCGDIVSSTREEAIQCAQYDNSYITTAKIEWEE